MTHTKANKSKISALILGLTMCLALMLGIVVASPTFAIYAEGGTTGGLTIGGESDMTGAGYFYKGATKTLTLQSYNGKEIYFYGDVIQLEGNNTITVDKTSESFLFPTTLLIIVIPLFILVAQSLLRAAALWRLTWKQAMWMNHVMVFMPEKA